MHCLNKIFVRICWWQKKLSGVCHRAVFVASLFLYPLSGIHCIHWNYSCQKNCTMLRFVTGLGSSRTALFLWCDGPRPVGRLHTLHISPLLSTTVVSVCWLCVPVFTKFWVAVTYWVYNVHACQSRSVCLLSSSLIAQPSNIIIDLHAPLSHRNVITSNPFLHHLNVHFLHSVWYSPPKRLASYLQNVFLWRGGGFPSGVPDSPVHSISHWTWGEKPEVLLTLVT